MTGAATPGRAAYEAFEQAGPFSESMGYTWGEHAEHYQGAWEAAARAAIEVFARQAAPLVIDVPGVTADPADLLIAAERARDEAMDELAALREHICTLAAGLGRDLEPPRELVSEGNELRAKLARTEDALDSAERTIADYRTLTSELQAERDDYAKRLRATDRSWAALAAERDELLVTLAASGSPDGGGGRDGRSRDDEKCACGHGPGAHYLDDGEPGDSGDCVDCSCREYSHGGGRDET